MKRSQKIKRILVGVAFVLSYSIFILCYWASDVFGVDFDAILFTITSPMTGVEMSVVLSALKTCLPGLVILIALYSLLVYLDSKIKITRTFKINIKKLIINIDAAQLCRRTVALLSVVSIAASLTYVVQKYNIAKYVSSKLETSTIYEDYYVDPKDANIRLAADNGEYKNLIYIYLESMETTYTSFENGGNQNVCYIPNLYNIAKENISFSEGEKLGGFYNTIGTGYTMGALLATSSGIPYSFPIGENSMKYRKYFASGLTTLGDVLDSFGYNQEFLCGSISNFAGKRLYFEQHGNYEIFDLYTAQDRGYIPKDYCVFWGYEDKYLYEIAKDEILKLAEKDEPFNLTMLTVDTHHISGYICELCEYEYPTQLENVVSCADRQIAAFLEWCIEQPFYEDTVIVLTGDHPRMDTDMVKDVDYMERTMYNCFINCTPDTPINTTNRVFSPMDVFPTTLSAMGFEWDGNRLGLGTNLFSPQKTLPEELGFDYFNAELNKKSLYYSENFY